VYELEIWWLEGGMTSTLVKKSFVSIADLHPRFHTLLLEAATFSRNTNLNIKRTDSKSKCLQ